MYESHCELKQQKQTQFESQVCAVFTYADVLTICIQTISKRLYVSLKPLLSSNLSFPHYTSLSLSLSSPVYFSEH